jgi:hypothetical protein
MHWNIIRDQSGKLNIILPHHHSSHQQSPYCLTVALTLYERLPTCSDILPSAMQEPRTMVAAGLTGPDMTDETRMQEHILARVGPDQGPSHRPLRRVSASSSRDCIFFGALLPLP